MPGAAFARGESVVLRTVETEDVAFLQRWRNHPDVRRPLTDADPRNGEQVAEYVENRVSGDGDGFGFVVCARDREAARRRLREYDGATPALEYGDDEGGEGDAADDRPVPVGTVHMPWIRQPHASGMIMYWIAPPHHGHGYVTEATGLLLEYAFDERRIAKATAIVLETNEGSQRVLEKLGFEREGVHRRETFVDGERRDNYRYGLLADEWRARSDGRPAPARTRRRTD
ncbi:GNAT family N-acetyltransferase [Halobacterium yunchengense]|uniref:GNAT family N-acetyltransferase n=1 Tax=Halobacterium yunchengense TaxID=3108497 RepID=UPI0030086A90